jgi:hypothetical protein
MRVPSPASMMEYAYSAFAPPRVPTNCFCADNMRGRTRIARAEIPDRTQADARCSSELRRFEALLRLEVMKVGEKRLHMFIPPIG